MRRRVVLLSVAGVLALLGIAALAISVAGSGSGASSDTEAAQVVVASAAITKGTPLAALRAQGLTATATFPLSTLPPDALTTLDNAPADAVATRDIAAREILVSSSVGTETTDRNAAAGLTLPPGTSAVPVSFKSFPNAADWSAWIQPGAEIAVYQTFTARTPGAPWTPRGDDLNKDDATGYEVTRLLLDRVKVLAVGGTPATGGGEGSTEAAPALVLALTQQQSERLIMGLGRESQLYPAVLAPGSAVAPSPGTIDTQLFDPLAPTPAVRP